MAIMNNDEDTSFHNGVLPVIPLSPVVQSYLTCSQALNVAAEELAEAKKAKPPVPVSILRGLMDTFKIETQRLATITRKMQTVEAATAIFWDADALARQIAIIDTQLFDQVLLDKRLLLSCDKESTRLAHFIDFHHYITHSVAHQLIYWHELLENPVAASAVVPTVNAQKDSLVSHWIRVAYLLLHAYRDFSSFAAIMKALTFPEVRRLKKLWANCTTRTKDMFKELVQVVSPQRNYDAYHSSIRTKLDLHKTAGGNMMVAVPWIQPHLLSIRSIVAAYTAGDNEDPMNVSGDIILSTPGANKLAIELSVLEFCQRQSFNSDFTLEEILAVSGGQLDLKRKRTKSVHLDGLREAVTPVSDLKKLAPGEQLIHHWILSRAYLRKDQLIHESMEVEPLKPGEQIACESDELDEILFSVKPPPMSKRNSVEQEEQELAEITHAVEGVEITPTDQSIETTHAGDEDTPEENDTKKDDSDDDDEGGEGSDPLTPSLSNEEVKEVELQDMSKKSSVSVSSSVASKSKSKLSPSAPVFVPGSFKAPTFLKTTSATTSTTDEKWNGYPVNEDEESETWGGYPAPSQEEEEVEDEVWKGYPGPRRGSSQSETSEEWKGYQATKMEADWQRESELKVQEHEWQGYALETLDEDELDSSTMMNGEFEKSRKARR